MKNKLLLTLFFSALPLFASVEHSIIPKMDRLVITDLRGKINEKQQAEIENTSFDNRVRVLSFNMLFPIYDHKLEEVHRWENRKGRVIEYIAYAHPDLIGSQELQIQQLNDICQVHGAEYGYCGKSSEAIFYLKERFELVKEESRTFTFAQFKDKLSGKEFIMLNTHLPFGNIEKRKAEAEKIRDFLLESKFRLPVIITGDFNTFSFRQELGLPFFDGEEIIRIIEGGGLEDSMRRSLLGHFGPISSTNYSSLTKKSFEGEGEPGIILDHVFISPQIRVLAHGIDPAKVNGNFPSDHLPVVVDFLIR